MTAQDFLRSFADLARSGRVVARHRVCERFDLDPDTVRELSHGNKQKVGLVQAFMHRPDLLILDEPTQGLDPLVQQTSTAGRGGRERGATVFLSSHVMPEVERVCDRVGIIRDGALVTVADVGELKAKARRRIEFHFDGPVPAWRSTVAGRHGRERARRLGMLTVEGPLDAVIKEAARHNVVSVETHNPASRTRSWPSTRTGPRRERPVSALLTKTLREQRRAFIAWAAGLAAVAAMYAAFYPSVRDSAADLQGYLENLPEALSRLFGGDFTTPAGYLRSETFSALG